MNYNKGNQPPWKQNAEETYGVFGHKKISHSPKEMTEIWPAWDDSNVRQTRLRRPVLCPAELQADIVNYSTLCKRCKHVDRIENGEMTRIFRYIFQSACQNRKYGLQYLCYKRVSFASRLNSVSRYIENARPYGKRSTLPNTSLGQRNIYETKQTSIFYRGMAQFGSALDWGSRGHGFKSRYSDHKLRWVHTMYALGFFISV